MRSQNPKLHDKVTQEALGKSEMSTQTHQIPVWYPTMCNFAISKFISVQTLRKVV